jgi:D-alanyl-D-alanine carboxypeptidase/D-alanyl-D-alanine-endopeptidase (penicillin-binding protein 4)
VIASVSSMPLERIVERLLMVSDNDAAEVVFRQAAIGAGKKGSIADATKVVRARLIKLGIWDTGTKINDGSGLARQTKVPADTMVKLLRAAAGDKHPGLRGVLTGLPASRGVCGPVTSTTRLSPLAAWSAARPVRSARCTRWPASFAAGTVRCWPSPS